MIRIAELSEARKRANKKWNDKNLAVRYDRINLVVPKGKKTEIQEHAKEADESLNGFVNRAIDETMERDNEKRQDSISTDTEVKAE